MWIYMWKGLDSNAGHRFGENRASVLTHSVCLSLKSLQFCPRCHEGLQGPRTHSSTCWVLLFKVTSRSSSKKGECEVFTNSRNSIRTSHLGFLDKTNLETISQTWEPMGVILNFFLIMGATDKLSRGFLPTHRRHTMWGQYHPPSFPFADWCTKKRKRNTALSSHKSRGPKKVLEKKKERQKQAFLHAVFSVRREESMPSLTERKAPSLSFPDSLKLLRQRPGNWSAGIPREEDHWCMVGPPCSTPYDMNNSSIYPEILTMSQNRTLEKQVSPKLRIHHDSVSHFKLGSSHTIWVLHDKVCTAHGCENAHLNVDLPIYAFQRTRNQNKSSTERLENGNQRSLKPVLEK